MSRLAPLAEQGYVVLDGFAPAELVRAAFDEQAKAFEGGEFRRARVGKGEGTEASDERRDWLRWMPSLSELTDSPASNLMRTLEALREELRQEHRLPLRELEFQATVYEPGTFYRRHVDTFRTGGAERLVSTVLFLNPEWPATNGGELRLHFGSRHVDILPAPGRLALFRSELVPHEVLPPRQARFAVSGWFRR